MSARGRCCLFWVSAGLSCLLEHRQEALHELLVAPVQVPVQAALFRIRQVAGVLPHKLRGRGLDVGEDAGGCPRQDRCSQAPGVLAVGGGAPLSPRGIRLDLAPDRALRPAAEAEDAVRHRRQGLRGLQHPAEDHGHPLHEGAGQVLLRVGGGEADEHPLHVRAQVRRAGADEVGQGEEPLSPGRAVRRQKVHLVVGEGPVEQVPHPPQGNPAGCVGVHHVEAGDGAAVAGHAARRVQDDVVRHGHGAEGGPRHVRKAPRAHVADAHGPAGEVDAADAERCPGA